MIADEVPGPSEAEPATTTLSLRLGDSQAYYFEALVDLLEAVSRGGEGAVASAGTLLLVLDDERVAATIRRVAHQLRVQAGTA